MTGNKILLYNNSHFLDKENEIQKGEVSCQKSHS